MQSARRKQPSPTRTPEADTVRGTESNDQAAARDPRTLAPESLRVLPGVDGFLSTWNVLRTARRPLGPEEEQALLHGCTDNACARQTVTAWNTPRMDFRSAVGRRGRVIYLSATLITDRSTDATLLVGARGQMRVWMDGQPLLEAESADRFREDFRDVRLALTPGEHQLVLRFDKSERGRFRASVRWLNAEDQPGTSDFVIVLPESSTANAETLLETAFQLQEFHELDGDALRIRWSLGLPAGGVDDSAVAHFGDQTHTFEPQTHHHAANFEHHIAMPGRGAVRVPVRIGNRRLRVGQRLASDRTLLRTVARLNGLLENAPDSARAPIQWRRDEGLRLIERHDSDERWRRFLQREAPRIARALERGRNPFEGIHGYERMAFISTLDQSAQPYELFVPPGYRNRGGRRWPLIITLHGFKGNAGDYFRNTFGLARQWREGETLVDHGRHGEPPTRGSMIVIAPGGRGQSMYRQAGEIDIMEALADVQERFRIHPDRIYITGGSMGGTGAAYLPYRHPGLFAAAAPLAGYHDQRVRADTNHETLTAAERFLQARRSDVDWAENGMFLPMLLVRGTRDLPLSWTRSLATRLEALNYRYELREPESGHNVWTETYEDGAIFAHFRRYRRRNNPRHVRLWTARERTQEHHWVRVDRRLAPDRFARIDARIDQEGHVTAMVEGVARMTLSPPESLHPSNEPLQVQLGEQSVEGPVPLTLSFDGTEWHVTSPPAAPEVRRAGVSGPIRDVYHERLLFVVGTQDPRHTFWNRRVAEHWSHPKGWWVDYPIVDDVDVTETMMREYTLVLIGPPHSNTVLAGLQDELPIRFEPSSVTIGARRFQGPQVGAAFVYPNPRAPEHSLLVIAGVEPLGTWRSTFLPDILPDYVVYDRHIEPARDGWSCGGNGGHYLAEGFFNMDWQLTPAEVAGSPESTR